MLTKLDPNDFDKLYRVMEESFPVDEHPLRGAKSFA